MEQAHAAYDPYAKSGTAANTRYNQLLGLGTNEERAAGQQTYLDDPMFQGVLGQQSNALLRQQNARGGTYSGASTMAAGRLGLENYGSYLDRLQGQGQQGLAATGAQSNVRLGQADMRYGMGATKAGQETNYGSARAQASQMGVNNLIGLAGSAAKVIGAIPWSDIRLKRDITQTGEMPSGLPVYEFAYVWGPERYRGVMAHEAEKLFPEAVSRNKDGFAMVNYSLIG